MMIVTPFYQEKFVEDDNSKSVTITWTKPLPIHMNYCPSCGKKADAGWNYCPNCGTYLIHPAEETIKPWPYEPYIEPYYEPFKPIWYEPIIWGD